MPLSIAIPPNPPLQPKSPTRTLHSSPTTNSEIERELSSVRSMRRRSGSIGGQMAGFDPDLPPTQDDLESAAGLRIGMGIAGHGLGEHLLSSSPSAHHHDSSSSTHDPSVTSTPDEDDEEEDTSHLFWVPAHLHPELAPGEFRAFLKEHAHAHAQEAASAKEQDPILSESAPGSSSPFHRQSSQRSSLGRKKSMLSRQYTPRHNDGVENERVPSLNDQSRRDRSSIYSSPFGTDEDQQVSLMDLQMLEELADEAAKSDDPSKLRSMLRRSWSINSGHGPDVDAINSVNFDESDAPVLAIRTGPSLIRRSARTKIRKAGMEGDAAHRFGPSRRGRTAHLVGENALHQSASTSPPSSEGHQTDESSLGLDDPHRPLGEDSTFSQERPVSTSSVDPYSIYDSYDRNSVIVPEHPASPEVLVESSGDRSNSPSPPNLHPIYTHPSLSETSLASEHAMSPASPTSPGLRSEVPYPEHNRSLASPTSPISPIPVAPPVVEAPLVATPAVFPLTSDPVHAEVMPEPHRPAKLERVDSHASTASSVASSSSHYGVKEKEKEKEKKGGFFSKKSDKKKDKSKGSSEKEKGFLSLFGGKKKNHEEPHSTVNSGEGRLAAAALLKTKGPPSPSSPSSFAPQSNFSRYPINVERAVYRLSHIKLANPRRPLYEQVLISNLMFWYLSIINKPATTPAVKEKDAEKAGETGERSREDIEAAEKAKVPASRGTPAGNLAKSLMTNGTPTPPAAKRTSLTKKEDPKNPGRPMPRSAEMPVKTPHYGAQNAQLEKEYRPVAPDNFPQQHYRPTGPPSQSSLVGPHRGGPPGNSELGERERATPQMYGSVPSGAGPSPAQGQRPLPNHQGRPPNNAPPNYDARGPPPGPHLARSASTPQPGSPRPLPQHQQSSPNYPSQQQQPNPSYPQHQQQNHSPSQQHSPRPGLPPNRGPPGPQPGQLFHHPANGARPGEALPQIGQVFNHPGYRPAPYRPTGPPSPGVNGPIARGSPSQQQQQGVPGGYYPTPNRPVYLGGGSPVPPNNPNYPVGLGRPLVPQQPTTARQGGLPQPPYPHNGPNSPHLQPSQQQRPYPPGQGPPHTNQGYRPPGSQQPPAHYNNFHSQQPPQTRRPTSSELPASDRG